jgi:outer membrane protein OmpA-like peptidoglycan-associated protein
MGEGIFSSELYPELEAPLESFPELADAAEVWPELSSELEWEAGGATAQPCLIRKASEIVDFFKFNSAVLRPFHIAEIKAIAKRIAASLATPSPIKSVHIVGHTDDRGPAGSNVNLGRNRAKAAAWRLRHELGPNKSKVTITTDTRGESSPVAPNTIARGRACNRRVELFFGGVAGPCIGCSFRHFFTEYDLRFLPGDTRIGIPANPNLTQSQKTARESDVSALVPILLVRRNTRAALALRGQVATGPAPPTLVPRVQRLSNAQLELYRQCFPDGSGGIHFGDFQRCFEQFANGELRDPSRPSEGGPNGGFFFLFAEFAFVCIDSGIEKTLWTNALKVFVKTQEIFIHVFRPKPHGQPPQVGAALPGPCTPKRPFDSTSPGKGDGFEDTNFRTIGHSNEARKAALRVKYDPMDLAALGKAAAENLLRAMCMP